jgi:hypothetical protein
MDASLDTNVIIHLYKANLQNVLFSRFDKLLVYNFIRDHEMVNHAGSEIIDLFDDDVRVGKIELISDTYFRQIGMYNVFMSHVNEHRILFGNGDLGEVYAIAMAKTLGCICLVTDDIKERGPHYTLMRIPDSDVIPFAFFEILILDYLEGKTSKDKLIEIFNQICNKAELEWDFESKLKGFIRRFWKDPYSDSEKVWMQEFCQSRGINPKDQLRKLIG